MDSQAEEPEENLPINKPEKEDTSVSDESEGVTMVFEPTVSNLAPIVQEDSLEEAEPGFEVESAASEEEYQGPELEPYNPTKDLENYRFPTIDLMKHFENDDPTIDMDEQNANKDRIINTLRSFGIEISTIKEMCIRDRFIIIKRTFILMTFLICVSLHVHKPCKYNIFVE